MKRKKKGSKSIFTGVYLLIPVIFLGIGFIWWKTGASIDKQSTTRNLNFIAEHVNASGKLIDYTGDICVSSISDIKLFVDDNEKVKIKYGKIDLEWDWEDFLQNDLTGVLEVCGITRTIDKKTGKLRVYYKGNELERWAH